MYDTLLVPLDGSTFSENALAHAAAIAERTGGTIRLALVHTPLPMTVTEVSAVPLLDQWHMDHREREGAYLEEQAKWLRERGLEVETLLRSGDVVRELRELAPESDLLVLATHGRGGLERAWLGSVADSLVRHVDTPLLLIRPHQDADEPPRSVAAPRRILVGSGGSPAALAVVEEAARLARVLDAKLTLLRVVAFPAGLGSPYIPHTAEMDRATVEASEAGAREALEELAGRFQDIEVDTMVTRAFHAARGILEAVDEAGADMVAVGAHRRTALGRAVLGSTADKVIRAAMVPVLVARTDG
jgi:nucleotide-binding universal stress UspA family protein